MAKFLAVGERSSICPAVRSALDRVGAQDRFVAVSDEVNEAGSLLRRKAVGE